LPQKLIGRRGLLALGAAAVAVGPACAAPPRPAGGRCTMGQAEIRPLEPLQIVTQKGPQRFMVEVARSPRQREVGMMCRTAIAPDRGMLFDFGEPQPLAFWMRNTLIPLDIVYVGANGRVVSIVANARPLDETPLPSGGPARAALELGGGRAAQIGLLPCDRVIHRIFP
jgi:uncharacterized protein